MHQGKPSGKVSDALEIEKPNQSESIDFSLMSVLLRSIPAPVH